MAYTKSSLRRHQLALVLGVFGVVFAASLYIQWNQLLREARSGAEADAQHLTRVFQEHLEEGLYLDRLLDDLEDPRTYEFLLETTRFHMLDLGLEKVKFYNLEGTIIFAEERALLGEDHSGKALFQQARAGETVSKLVRPKQYMDSYGVPQFSSLVETYTPVTGAGGKITHVMEVYRDFDHDLARSKRLLVASGLQLGAVLLLAAAAVLFLQRRVEALEHEVDTLESFLPICAYCKKIRVEKEGQSDRWVAVDLYLQEREMAAFSHGICEECLGKHFPDDAD